MSFLVFKKLQQLRSKTFGFGKFGVSSRLYGLGFSLSCFNQPRNFFNFVSLEKVEKLTSPRLVKFLQNNIASKNLRYNLGLIKQIKRRIELLKFNRSWKGARHACFLPVRGQRTKTNARIQKSRRKKKI